MTVPTYRVTERKLKEHLGEAWEGYFNLFKSKTFRLVDYLFFGSALLNVFFLMANSALKINPWLDRHVQWLIPLLLIIVLLTEIVLYFLMKHSFRQEISRKMKELVNDPELLWVNSAKLPEEPITKWHRRRRTYFTPVTFQVLSCLKKEGTSQGIYTKIKSMKNSNSAYQTLKRLADKKVFDEPIVRREGSDFRYVPWKFRLIDEQNRTINTPKAGEIEKLLERCWEEGMEEER